MDWLARHRNRLLIAAVVVVLAGLPVAQRLTFDQSIESFFPRDNPDIAFLQRAREDFGGDELVIVAWPQPGLIADSPDGRYPQVADAAAARITELTGRMAAIPGVDGERTRDLVRLLNKAPRNRNTRTALLRLFRGILIGADQQTTAIVLQLRPAGAEAGGRDNTIHQIRDVARAFDSKAAVAGEAVQIHDMFELVERDGGLLYLGSLLILTVMLQLIFRQFRYVLAAVGIVVASVTATRALLVLAGAQLSMVSSMLNSLVTIISISTTTHIIVHYRELRAELDAESALRRTLVELWRPVMWTMISLAAGFAALLVSQIVPIRSFAVMMTLATLLVPLFTLAILPAALASGVTVPVPGRVQLEDRLDRTLTKVTRMVERHPAGTTIGCLLVTAITLPGLFLMQVETDFSRNFRESSSIVQSLRFVEDRLGSAGTWDIAMTVPDPLTDEFLNQLTALTESLQALAAEGLPLDVLSLTDAVNVPPRLGTPLKRLDTVRRRQPDLVDDFYNARNHRLRIVLRSPEQQPAAVKLDQIHRVRQVINEHVALARTEYPGAVPDDAMASGLFVLMARVIDSLLADQWKSFFWAAVGTTLCMTIAFRSLRIGLISLVPNVFPIALVTGSLGLLQIPVNIGTAMIASVSMGFTCSVHYIAVFQEALPREGLTMALQTAQTGVGKAVVLAHLALVAGFLVLTTSEFIPLVYFGALLSLSMVGGLVSDLLLLPLLLRWTTPAGELPESAN
jgi:hypothetical protein